MTSVLVTGANRGLGLGLVQKLLQHENPPTLVLTSCRDPSNAAELLKLKEKHSNLQILQLDVTDPSTFSSFAGQVSDVVGDSGLNVLINMAGISKHKDVLDDVTVDDYLETYKTNVIGPVFLIKALLPLIKTAAAKNEQLPGGMNKAAILNVSSLLGSVGCNVTGGHYSYRESKAAINMFSRNLALELKDTGILVLSIHPGWVATDLGGPNAPLTVEQSVTGLCNLVYCINDSNNDHFLQWDGAELKW